MSSGSFDVSNWPARLGVRRGEALQLSADVTRMAWNARRAGTRFDPAQLLDAFADAVGPEGLLLIPTFTFDLRDGDGFDVRRTRSISGALANAALDHPRFTRTQHPLHSFAIAGGEGAALATAAVAGSFDREGPLGALHWRSGVLIALDLPLNDALSFVHYVEQAVGVPYRRTVGFTIRHTDALGATSDRRYSIYAKQPGHINDFSPLEDALRSAGALTQGELDGSRWIRVDLARAYDLIAADIRTNKARSIHRFSWDLWLREHTKNALRTFGFRTRRERAAHAARTP